MSNVAPVNANPDEKICVYTQDMPWTATDHPGIGEKILERIIDPVKGRTTALLKFEPGAAMPTETLGTRTEIFVLEGRLSDGLGEYGKHTFIRDPAGTEITLSSKTGCEIYIKRRIPFREDDERLVIDTTSVEWMKFPHRGAEVVHFYRDRHGIDTSRLGIAHADVRIPSHDHSIGEETLIVEGIFNDEYATYGPGSWMRFPIGLPHAPFTGDEPCMLLIREGDLVW